MKLHLLPLLLFIAVHLLAEQPDTVVSQSIVVSYKVNSPALPPQPQLKFLASSFTTDSNIFGTSSFLHGYFIFVLLARKVLPCITLFLQCMWPYWLVVLKCNHACSIIEHLCKIFKYGSSNIPLCSARGGWEHRYRLWIVWD